MSHRFPRPTVTPRGTFQAGLPRLLLALAVALASGGSASAQRAGAGSPDRGGGSPEVTAGEPGDDALDLEDDADQGDARAESMTDAEVEEAEMPTGEEESPNLGARAADLPAEPVRPEEDQSLELRDDMSDAERTAALEMRRDLRYAPEVSLHGEYRLRTTFMSDIPLQTQARTGIPGELGQNIWASQWLRLTGRLELGQVFAFETQVDLADGLLAGDETQGVGAADLPRDGDRAFDGRGVELRWLYGEWKSPIGVFRAGLQPSHWGMGLIANDGTRWSPFGDYRYGNSNLRFLFATRPGGEDVPFTIALAGDLVYRDPVADLTQDQRALQGVLAAFFGDGREKTLGAYVVYRAQRDSVDTLPGEIAREDRLDVWILDLFAQWSLEDPAGGEISLAFEGAHIRGETTLTRSVDRPTHDVRQWLWAAQVGRRGDVVDGFIEVGYTSGDSNTEDSAQRRATMHPDHRIGLILFPEVLAWHSARSATLASSDELSARPAPGSSLLPTNGGVAGATYLFNWWDFRPLDFMNVRVGWLWARATSDVVDPYQQRTQSRSVNYLGGDPRARDLGLELDAMVLFTKKLPYGISLQGGLDGGVFLPGRAFDTAAGERMNPVWLGRLRGRLKF